MNAPQFVICLKKIGECDCICCVAEQQNRPREVPLTQGAALVNRNERNSEFRRKRELKNKNHSRQPAELTK
jgi:hypothetical protein